MNQLSSIAMITSVAVSNNISHLKGDILDIGCGAKPYKRLVNLGDEWLNGITSWTGVDVRPVGDIQADMTALPIEDESYDSVISTDALQYADDPIAAMGEMVRVLKPQGHLLLTCPNVCSEDESAMFSFKMHGLLNTFGRLGCEVIEARTYSKLFEHEFNNYANTSPGLTWPPSVAQFLSYLDTAYPAINVIVARKE